LHFDIIKSLRDEFHACKQVVDKLDQTSMLKQEYLNDKLFLEEKLRNIDFSLEDLDLNQNTTDNYLDKYIPFRIQNFISENLEVIMTPEQSSKFIKFEK